MKQFEVLKERTLNGNTFYIRPFSAFKSANLSGEIMSIITPVIASIASIAPIVSGANVNNGGEVNLLDVDAEKAAPYLANAMQGLSGEKVEMLLKKLLILYKNISVQLDGEKEAQILTEDVADEVFCAETQDMFVLAFDVIKVNYSGFFRRLGGQFGSLVKTLAAKNQPSPGSMVH